MGKFDKRTAIVTGGARGIGGGTARKLAEGGAHVIIIDIDESSAVKNVSNIKSFYKFLHQIAKSFIILLN